MIQSSLAPALLRCCEKHAPKAQVAYVAGTFQLPREGLESGDLDLGIAGFFRELPDGFYQQKLYRDTFLCAVRSDHPRLSRGSKGRISRMELDAYCAESHILIAPSGDLKAQMDAALAKKKRKRFICVGLSGFTSSGWVVASSDAILTGPARLLKQLGPVFGLRLFEPPLALPEIQVFQVWHERNNADPAHRWLREQVRCLLAPTS